MPINVPNPNYDPFAPTAEVFAKDPTILSTDQLAMQIGDADIPAFYRNPAVSPPPVQQPGMLGSVATAPSPQQAGFYTPVPLGSHHSAPMSYDAGPLPVSLSPDNLLTEVQSWDAGQLRDFASKMAPILVYKQYQQVFRDRFQKQQYIYNPLTNEGLIILENPANHTHVPFILASQDTLESAFRDPNQMLNIETGSVGQLQTIIIEWLKQIDAQQVQTLSRWIGWLTGKDPHYHIAVKGDQSGHSK